MQQCTWLDGRILTAFSSEAIIDLPQVFFTSLYTGRACLLADLLI
jgi:hypothetical protein